MDWNGIEMKMEKGMFFGMYCSIWFGYVLFAINEQALAWYRSFDISCILQWSAVHIQHLIGRDPLAS